MTGKAVEFRSFLRRYSTTAIVLLFLVLGFLGMWGLQQENNDAQNRANQAQIDAQIAACERGNIVRARQNDVILTIREIADIVNATSTNPELGEAIQKRAQALDFGQPVDCATIVEP